MVERSSQPLASLRHYFHCFRYIVNVKGLGITRRIDGKVCNVDTREYVSCEFFDPDQPTIFKSNQCVANNAARRPVQQDTLRCLNPQSLKQFRMPQWKLDHLTDLLYHRPEP